jgi:hypothetical protein
MTMRMKIEVVGWVLDSGVGFWRGSGALISATDENEVATNWMESRGRQDTHRRGRQDTHRIASVATVTTRAQQINMVIIDDAHASRSRRIYC